MSSTAEDVHPGPPEPSSEDDLAERQRKVVQAIRGSIEKRGFPPFYREIRDAAELKSISAVSHQLAGLEAKGVLRREPGRPRAIELLQPALSAASAPENAAIEALLGQDDTVLVPLIGRIAAGPPMLAEENIEGTFRCHAGCFPVAGECSCSRSSGIR